MQMFNDVGQVVTTRYPACYSFNSKVVAWLLQPPFTTLLLGCHKVVTTRYPACYSFNSKVVSPGYKVVAWLLQPTFTTLLLGCHKVVTTKYPACYSFNSKVVSPRVQGCCMVVKICWRPGGWVGGCGYVVTMQMWWLCVDGIMFDAM